MPVSKALDLLRHRGPDGQSVWRNSNGTYVVGFARLSIIDLETGDQPICDDTLGITIAGNGEIYNYRELRAEYEAYKYATTGDMEPVIPVYASEGISGLDKLNGMYALSIYERKQHRLTLVRDRLGVKPIYWTMLSSGGVAFASEIKALFGSGLVTPAINEEAVTAYLGHGYVPGPKTIFENVMKVPQGHTLVINDEGEVKVTPYWRPTAAHPSRADADEAANELLTILRDSIRLQLRSDVPIGILLSGGLDSGLLTALAAEQSESPLNTYCVSFEGAPVDEGPLAAQVADRYGAHHTRVVLPAGNAETTLPMVAWHMDEPMCDAAAIPNFLIEKALGQKLRVALNGTGGDELFAGYGRYRMSDVERKLSNLPTSILRSMARGMDAFSPLTAWKIRRAISYEHNPGAYTYAHTTLFPDPLLKLIGHRCGSVSPAHDGFVGPEWVPRETRALLADIGTYLVDDLLYLVDRSSMAASVEGRVPYLDHRFVDAALAVDPSVRSAQNVQKALQRQISKTLLPSDILSAPKQGFASPVAAWMQSGLASPARRLLSSKRALERGWWSADGIERLFTNPAKSAFPIYSLLTLELCVRFFVEGPMPESAPAVSVTEIADDA